MSAVGHPTASPFPPLGVRALIAAAAGLALVTALWGGLVRIGWSMGDPPAVSLHGPLLVLGFLGTVIGMERAIGLRRPWPWIVPALGAASVVAMVLQLDARLAAALLTAAGVGLVAVFVLAHRIAPGTHIIVMGAGALCWAVGAAAWAVGGTITAIVPALAGFVVLTIAGERLELTRMIGATASVRWQLMVVSVIVLVGAAVGIVDLEWGARITGLGLIGVAAWLALYDIAKRTIRQAGVTRYMAGALLLGYVWLALSGVLWLSGSIVPGTLRYDAAVHAVFLGFVMSMVFAHAPIILPALSRLPVSYHAVVWMPLILLHGSLVLRIAGDLTGNTGARQWGAMLNTIAITLFVAVMASRVVAGRKMARSRN